MAKRKRKSPGPMGNVTRREMDELESEMNRVSDRIYNLERSGDEELAQDDRWVRFGMSHAATTLGFSCICYPVRERRIGVVPFEQCSCAKTDSQAEARAERKKKAFSRRR